ncbi:GNAT family N-acetyltransferase [Flexivirga sp. B27]
MLRPATDADKENARVWRNHPQVRAVSLTQEIITPEDHETYWESLRDNAIRRVFIFEFAGVPAGVVTFFDIDDEARTAMWGYYLDNAGLEQRGQVLPAWIKIQREAVKLAFGELDLAELYGEVLDANEAVRSMNTRNGFEEIDAEQRTVGGRPVTVHTIRRRRQPHD